MERCEQRRMLAGDGVLDGLVLLLDGDDSITVGGTFVQLDQGTWTEDFAGNLSYTNSLSAADFSASELVGFQRAAGLSNSSGLYLLDGYDTDAINEIVGDVSFDITDAYSPYLNTRIALGEAVAVSVADGFVVFSSNFSTGDVEHVDGDYGGYDPPLIPVRLPEPAPPEFPPSGGGESEAGFVSMASVFDISPAVFMVSQDVLEPAQPREIQLAGNAVIANAAVLDRALAFEVPGPTAEMSRTIESEPRPVAENADEPASDDQRFFHTAGLKQQPGVTLAGHHFGKQSEGARMALASESTHSGENVAREAVLAEWYSAADSGSPVLASDAVVARLPQAADTDPGSSLSGHMLLERSGEALPWLAVLATHRVLSRGRREGQTLEEPRRGDIELRR